VTPPETIFGRENGYHSLLDMSMMNIPDVHTATIVSREYLANNRENVFNFLKATTEAVYRLKRNKAEALHTLSKHLQLDLEKDAAALNATWEFMIVRHFADLPYPSLPNLQAMIDEIAVDNPAVADIKPEQIADSSLIQALEDSHFLEGLAAQQQ
jgi:hypothetical protein